MTTTAQLDNLNREERVYLTKAVISLLDAWGLENEHIVDMLALPEGTPPRQINRYRSMGEPLPMDSEETLKRIEHILAIAEALRTMFPRNPQMARLWMQQPCKKLRGRIPIAIMLFDGIEGMIKVRSHLDCTYAWDLTGSHC